MNPDETKSLITKVLLVLFSSLSTALHLSPDASTLAASASDVADLIVLGYGIYSHRGMIKVSETAKVIGGAVLLALALGLASPPVSAANLAPPPANPFTKALSTPACTLTSCTGLFVGGSISQAGGNFDVIGTGLTGLASNDFALGGQFGYEFWNGQIYAAVLVPVTYDTSINAPTPLGQAFTDKLTWGVEGRLGYSLASLFGAAATGSTAPTLPQQLLASLMTPYVNIGEVRRHNQPALVSGAGVEALIATNWTLNADYLHYTYGQGGSAGSALPGAVVSQTNDNEVRISINRHFGL